MPLARREGASVNERRRRSCNPSRMRAPRCGREALKRLPPFLRGKESMSFQRLAAFAAATSCALLLGGTTGVASAQEGPARLTQVVPISGTTTKGKQQFTGTYTIERFISKAGKLYSVGTVKGKLGAKKV